MAVRRGIGKECLGTNSLLPALHKEVNCRDVAGMGGDGLGAELELWLREGT